MESFGIDVGGVLIDRVKGDDSDTSMFSDRYLETPEVPDAIDTLAKLGAGRWKGNLFIVSKAGNRMRAKTMEWLGHRKFWERTGMLPEQAFFTYTRQEKAPIAKQLGLTHFVDDRLEILASLGGRCRIRGYELPPDLPIPILPEQREDGHSKLLDRGRPLGIGSWRLGCADSGPPNPRQRRLDLIGWRGHGEPGCVGD